MEQETKQVTYAESVRLFAETMKEMYISRDKNCALLIVAPDGNGGSQTVILGETKYIAVSLASMMVDQTDLIGAVDAAVKAAKSYLAAKSLRLDIEKMMSAFKRDIEHDTD